MKRKQIGVRRLKNEASKVINEVREQGSEYVVTRRGKPVAVLRPLNESEARDGPSERARAALIRLRETSRDVGAVAGRESAAAAVSRQRR